MDTANASIESPIPSKNIVRYINFILSFDH
jgi:hypothetical protein